MITRIVKLPKHDDVLIGRDLAKIFKNGHVYEVKEYLGEITIRDIGETALAKRGSGDWPTEDSAIDQIMLGSPAMVFFTLEEEMRRKAMNAYETELMSPEELENFIEFFDRNVGTDYEVNVDPDGSDKCYVMCFDMDIAELEIIRNYEQDNGIGGPDHG